MVQELGAFYFQTWSEPCESSSHCMVRKIILSTVFCTVQAALLLRFHVAHPLAAILVGFDVACCFHVHPPVSFRLGDIMTWLREC